MNKIFTKKCQVGLFLLLLFSLKVSAVINVVPKPNSLIEGQGFFTFKQGMTIVAPHHSGAAALLESKLEHAAGIRLQSGTSTQKAAILLSIDTSAIHAPEGYQIRVDAKRVIIKAATETGLYYGVQTLLQLLPPQIESNKLVKATWKVPAVTIADAPAFSYRGIMLDACRHFISIDHIKTFLDVFAMYKINRFHWHLTDDQGWRIQIKRYPKLTQIGGTRVGDNEKPYGGYYTQEQIRDIVKYAGARHIEVIPEIEMPGHAMAALAAYPQYSCTGGPFKVRTTWGVEKNVYCAGNDSTYTFLSHILDEVCALFPSPYIHIGGDECPKDRWKECPKCQARMKEEGLKNEDELQSYFVKRMEKILEKKEKKIIGWDEILEGGIAPSATIMSWRGEQGGIDAANAGHDVIMTPGSSLYLDHYQGNPLCEPVKIGGLTTLQQVYAYHPIPKAISPTMAHHVLGLQGNLWSEYLYTPNEFDYQLFPRALAVAEIGWTKSDNKDVNDFIRRMDDQQIRLDEHHIDYYIPMPEGNLNYMDFTDSLRLPFTTNRPVKVVYTVDGTIPTAYSTTYKTPIHITKTTTLKLRSILPQGEMSAVRTIHLTKVTPLAAVSVEAPQTGLRMRYTTQGNYRNVAQLQTVKDWKDTLVANVNDFFKLLPAEQPGGGAIFTGYILISKDDIYKIGCLADQLFINNKLVINNDGRMKKNAPTDISLPLKAGYHLIKVILVNRTDAGVASSWIDASVFVQSYLNDENSINQPAKLFFE
jgi:hexosaminidase